MCDFPALDLRFDELLQSLAKRILELGWIKWFCQCLDQRLRQLGFFRRHQFRVSAKLFGTTDFVGIVHGVGDEPRFSCPQDYYVIAAMHREMSDRSEPRGTHR